MCFLAGDISQSIKYWPCKHEVLSSFSKIFIFKKKNTSGVTLAGDCWPVSLTHFKISRPVSNLVSKDDMDTSAHKMQRSQDASEWRLLSC